MEENTARIEEFEPVELIPAEEEPEASEDSSAGAFVAGIAGGVLAYALIGGAKKLATIVKAKLDARKQKKADGETVEGEFVEFEPEQATPNAETQSM